MSKEITKPCFSFTYAELLMKTAIMGSRFNRDREKFIEFGFPPELITDFEKNAIELNNLLSDLEMETFKMVAVENKNKTADEILTMLKRLIIYAKQVYEADSVDLKPYNIENPTKLSDAELSFQADILARYTKLNIADFTDVNLTEAFCDEMIAKNEIFKNQYADIKTKNKERDKATDLRWTKANEVYRQMMRICEIGKFMWEAESEADYNDYIIYPTSKSTQSTKLKKKAETEIDDDEDVVG